MCTARTVGDLLDLHLEFSRERARHGELKPATITHYESAWAHTAGLRALPLDSTRTADIARWHGELSRLPHPTTGAPMLRIANAALGFVSRAFAWGAARGVGPEVNPAKAIRRNPERPRRRWLQEIECARFLAALRDEEAKNKASRRPYLTMRARASAIAALRVLYLTGCRRREITGLAWSSVDADGVLLRLPDSKRGPRLVPISAGALQLIERRRGLCGNSPWVFPSTDPRRPVDALGRLWSAIRDSAGFGSDVCIHTLRHTWACHALLADTPIDVVSQVLGHSSVTVTERYYAHVLVTRGARVAASAVGARLAALGELAA